MKNYLIGTLAVIVIFLITVIYKQQSTLVFNYFPVQEEEETRAQSLGTEAPLYLFLFFSKKNCFTCLDEIVKVLNSLSPPFYVTGVVPADELEDDKSLRRITGAAFPLSSFNKYKRYVPWYTPMLIGVSPPGKIVFVLPGISVTGTYLKNFLISVYDKFRTQ